MASITFLNRLPLRIFVVCADQRIGKAVAARLGNLGVSVRLSDDPDLALWEIGEYEPKLVWAISTGDHAFQLGRFCRQAQIEDVFCPLAWKLFWVGKDQPEGLSVVADSFPSLPSIDKLLAVSRAAISEQASS